MTRVLAFIALIGCALAFAGLFTPWLAVMAAPDPACRASAWDCMTGRDYDLISLHPPVFLWLVPVGAFAALAGAVFTVVLPGMRAPWFAILAGTLTAIVGAVCALPGKEWYVSHCLCMLDETYQYGVFLTLAGSVVGALAGLMGLSLLTQIRRREASPSP
jgi:hypothetical protein